jgi:hypothetical protein
MKLYERFRSSHLFFLYSITLRGKDSLLSGYSLSTSDESCLTTEILGMPHSAGAIRVMKGNLANQDRT